MKNALAALATAGILLFGSAAVAAPKEPRRVAVLGPKGDALVPRLQRNFADRPAALASAVVESCARVTVAKELRELAADLGICTDGDTVTVWTMDEESVQLIEALPILYRDDRNLELIAARATMVARRAEGATDPVIVTNGSGAPPPAAEPAPVVTDTRDAPQAPPAPHKLERIAPSAVLGAGPMLLASKAGSAFALSLDAEIGVTRVVTLVPWVATVLAPKDVSNGFGSASYRPTIFGLGFGVPLRANAKTVVPRIGGGYALLWMHTWPQSAAPGATIGQSEDLWAPAIYANVAVSFRITEHLRAVAEAMAGTSSHHMIVRLGREHAADWGVPIASLAARAEVVIP